MADQGNLPRGARDEVFGALIIVTKVAWLILLRVRRLIAEIMVNASRPQLGYSHRWPRRPKN
jgi:hypothetical protein